MFYLLLLQYLVPLADTGATESPYEIFRNDVENIVVTTNSPQEYWHVTCSSSVYNKTWSLSEPFFKNDSHYEFETHGKLYFCLNLTFSKNEILNEIKCYHKYNIPLRLRPLYDVQISSSETADPYKASLKLKVIPSSVVTANVHRTVYRVRYQSEWETESPWKVISSTAKHFALDDLTPFTNYTFIADARPSSGNAFWTKPIEKHWRTETAVPYPAETSYFRYYEWSCPQSTNRRCITVYWQSLPVEFRNDILTGYCVQYIDGSSTNNTKQCLDPNNLIVDSLFKEFQDLPRNETLTFSIVAVTESKRMSQPAFIQVKNTAPRKPTAVYVTKISDKMYNVSWLIEQPQEAVNVTVFWCLNKITYSDFECSDEGEWITVVNESYVLVNYSLEQLPVFAAHVSTEEGRSSLTKAECIFMPGKSTKPRKPHINWLETKFSLTWPTLQCSDWNDIPIAYVLHYAEGKSCENGKGKEFPVNGTKAVENDVVINGLSSDTEYSVCIQLKTKDGLSLMSDPTIGMTKDTDSSEIYLYLFMLLVTVLFIISALFTCIRSHCKYATAIKVATIDRVPSYTDLDHDYEKIQDDENQLMDDSKYTIFQTGESGYYSSYNSSGTEKSLFPSEEFLKSAIHFPDYLQVNELTGKLLDKSKDAENINVKTASLCNKTDDIENVSYETGYIDEPGDYSRLCRSPGSVPTCVDGNMEENVSCRTDYVDEPNSSFSELSSMSVPTCVDGNMEENVSCRTDYVDEPNSSFSELSSMSVPTCVDGNMKENVSCRTDYVDEPNSSFSELSSMSVPTCVDGNMKENVSYRTDYVDEPDSSFSELSSMPVPTCVDGNMKENVSYRTDYVDEPDSSFSELSSMPVPTCEDDNMEENVSCRTDYVDEPDCSFSVNGNLMNIVSSSPDYVDELNGLAKLVPNPIPPYKNTNSNRSITDYITSEPDYISGIPEESTNSYKSKPLKGQILQTENKESNHIDTSKFNGRTVEENVKVNCNDGYVPHEHVEAMDSSLDEVQDKNIQNERQGLSQNPTRSCNLVNANVHKPSDSLQRLDKKMDKLQDTEQTTGTVDYVKTESFLGYVSNEISHFT
ncbi:XP_036367362.1uncharacterized protein LOC115222071 isoform X2 [Octopus vulgaris]|nr:XP_036367362.1uncharacterized protein LOC115222071 isoform X2 [Octopus vulgaris]